MLNIGSGGGVVLNEIIAGAQTELYRKIVCDGQSNRVIDVHRNVLTIGLARPELSGVPSIPLTEALARTAKGWRSSA